MWDITYYFLLSCERGESAPPKPEHNDFIYGKQGAEDFFVVARQPIGKMDVEVVRLLVCKAGRLVRQWTPSAIQGKDSTFNENQQRQDQYPAEVPHQRGERQSQNTSRKESPRGCVCKLDCYQHRLVRFPELPDANHASLTLCRK